MWMQDDRLEKRLRDMLDAVLYVLTTAVSGGNCQRIFRPARRCTSGVCAGTVSGVLDLHFALYQQARELPGKGASPTTAIVESQRVKSAEKGGCASSGVEAQQFSARGQLLKAGKLAESRAPRSVFASSLSVADYSDLNNKAKPLSPNYHPLGDCQMKQRTVDWSQKLFRRRVSVRGCLS